MAERKHRKGRRVKGITMLWSAYRNGCDFLAKFDREKPTIITNTDAAEMTLLTVETLLTKGTIHIAVPKGVMNHGNKI